MIVSSPWEHTALVQQLIANLEDTENPGLQKLDMNLKLRQVRLLHCMVLIFQALENNEHLVRDYHQEGGKPNDNKM